MKFAGGNRYHEQIKLLRMWLRKQFHVTLKISFTKFPVIKVSHQFIFHSYVYYTISLNSRQTPSFLLSFTAHYCLWWQRRTRYTVHKTFAMDFKQMQQMCLCSDFVMLLRHINCLLLLLLLLL